MEDGSNRRTRLSKIALAASVFTLAACGSDDETSTPMNGGQTGGSAGTAATGGQGGGSGGTAGSAGLPQGGSGGFSSNVGINPITRLDQLMDASIMLACEAANAYFKERVPDADVIRSFCVTDAVFAQGATTVSECHEISMMCIAAAPPDLGPAACSGAPENFMCTSTLGEFEQCVTDLTEAEKTRIGLLVCESIEDPDIEQKLADAGPPQTCLDFAQNCPGLFPDFPQQ